jgi:hypothetical protein
MTCYRTLMVRLMAPALLVSTVSAFAQIQSAEMTFDGVGCVPCVESMPSRAKRIRGVEEAKVNSTGNALSIRLAPKTRVRIEQIRDLIEQDGTKARSATIEVLGTVSEDQGKTILTVPEQPLPFELITSKPTTGLSNVLVKGTITRLRPDQGQRLRIEVRDISPAN